MKVKFARDPLLAMDELKMLHRALLGCAATPEKFREFCRAHPEYKGGIPLFVGDYLANIRVFMAHENGLEKFRRAMDLPPLYLEALLTYVKRFPLDSPRPGEVRLTQS